MNLQYRILWVDDNTEGLEDLFNTYISGQIKELGFTMELLSAKDRIELDNIVNKDTNFDLIFIDYTFNDKNEGIDFIKNIRSRNMFSNVIFYSAALDEIEEINKIKNELVQKDVHGVYIYRRSNILRDVGKINDMIRFDILRNLDLSAMRGITMAEVAESDHVLLDIINLLPDNNKWNIIEQNSKNARQHHCAKLINTYSDREARENMDATCKKILSIPDETLRDEILKDAEKSSRIFPSTARTQFLYGNKIFETIICKFEPQAFETFKQYKTEVLEIRNKLAHYKDPGDIDYTKLRQNIILHKNNIIKIRDILAKYSESDKSVIV